MEPTPIELFDDASIDGEIALLRRINPDPVVGFVDWENCDSLGRPAPNSGSFQLASLGYSQKHGYNARTISVFIEAVVVESYGSVEAWWDLKSPGSTWGVVRVRARTFREEGGMLLMRDDLGGHLGHTVGWAGVSNKRAKAAQQPLAQNAEWVISPSR